MKTPQKCLIFKLAAQPFCVNPMGRSKNSNLRLGNFFSLLKFYLRNTRIILKDKNKSNTFEVRFNKRRVWNQCQQTKSWERLVNLCQKWCDNYIIDDLDRYIFYDILKSGWKKMLYLMYKEAKNKICIL